MQRFLSILIIIISTILLQAHSIPFWVDHTGYIYGYIWSIAIESATIWAWLNKYKIEARLLSIVVILIPMWQLGTPMMNEIRESSVNTQITKLNNLDIELNKNLQNKYLGTNWAGRLKESSDNFRESIKSQKEHLKNDSKLKSLGENLAMIALQGFAILMIFVIQIRAISTVEFQRLKTTEAPNFSNSEIVETPEIRAKQLLSDIEDYMVNESINQLEISVLLGVSSSTISKLKNRINGAGERLSDKKLSELESKFKEIE